MHKHDWKIDGTRKHGRKGRHFVRCSCGERAQCSENGFVFKTERSEGLVSRTFRITKEQAEWLKSCLNQSEEVRFAIDCLRGERNTSPQNT